MSFFGELLRRRVPQILGLYLGASWIVVEFTNMIVERYLLSDTFVDMVLVTLLVLLPTVAMLAWNHGAPGPDGWRKSEAVGISVNVLGAVGVLVALFGGEQLGAAAYTVETVDEQGNMIVQEVPKAAFFSTVEIFFSTPDATLGEQSWLAYATPVMLETALKQDPFINTSTLYSGGATGLVWRAQRAGFRDALNLPVGLMREIAEASLQDHFVATELSRQGQTYLLDVQVYQVTPLKRIREGQVTATDPYELMEQGAAFVRKHLDVQQAGTRVADEYPIAELLTPSLEALEAFIEGERLLLLENDPVGARDALLRAVEIDESFARAHLALADALLDAGDFNAGRIALDKALASKFRLPEDEQYSARAAAYALDQDFERERALYEMWSRVRPNATEPLNRLGLKLAYDFDEPEQALGYIERSLEIDPSQDWLMLHLATVHAAAKRYDIAEDVLQRQLDLRPDNYIPLAALAGIETRRGNLQAARGHLEEAAIVGGDMVTPRTELANLDMREGDLESAQNELEQAENIARAPRQYVTILEQQLLIERTRGRAGAALEILPQLAELQGRYQDPISTLINVWMMNMDLYGWANLKDEGLAKLEELTEGLNGPMVGLIDIGHLKLSLGSGDEEEAATRLEPVRNLIEAFNAGQMRYALKLTEAAINLDQGRFELAATAAQSAIDTYQRSTKASKPLDDYYTMAALLGAALRLSGKAVEAAEVLSAALAEWPWHPVLNLEMALTMVDLNRTTEASEAVDRALRLWEDADQNYGPKLRAQALRNQLGGSDPVIGASR